MRKLTSCLAAATLVGALAVNPVPARSRPPHEGVSPPGQIAVVTINAKQARVLGLPRFLAMFELARALRVRPEAFNGGYDGAVQSPDIVIVVEIRPTNAEILERLIRQRYSFRYRIAGSSQSGAVIIYNSDSLQMTSAGTWSDVCIGPESDGNGRHGRVYSIARFADIPTGAPLTVAGVHFAKDYQDEGSDCLERNVAELRAQLAADTGAVVIGGDFNKRPMSAQYECDPNEESPPMQWWLDLTAPPDGGRAYLDAVREHHRLTETTVKYEWTHEQRTRNLACDGVTRYRRTRIDYLFTAGTTVAQAHADHPGWAASTPGGRHPTNFKYSDHRWVWGRFVVSGPPPSTRPTATAGAGGEVTVAWRPADGVTGWIVLRAVKGHAYGVLRRLPPDAIAFTDTATRHGTPYRYAVAPVGLDGGHGLESRPTRAVPDARGPVVVGVDPPSGAYGVDPGIKLTVRFNEPVLKESVERASIELFLGDQGVPGRTYVVAPRLVRFNPSVRLPGLQTYRAVVHGGVTDRLGNPARRYEWRFRTRYTRR